MEVKTLGIDLAKPVFAREAFLSLGAELESLAAEIPRIERRLMVWHRKNRASQRLETILGWIIREFLHEALNGVNKHAILALTTCAMICGGNRWRLSLNVSLCIDTAYARIHEPST